MGTAANSAMATSAGIRRAEAPPSGSPPVLVGSCGCPSDPVWPFLRRNCRVGAAPARVGRDPRGCADFRKRPRRAGFDRGSRAPVPLRPPRVRNRRRRRFGFLSRSVRSGLRMRLRFAVGRGGRALQHPGSRSARLSDVRPSGRRHGRLVRHGGGAGARRVSRGLETWPEPRRFSGSRGRGSRFSPSRPSPAWR